MPAGEALKRRLRAVEERRVDTGFTVVAIRAVYPGDHVSPTEEIFPSVAEAKAAAVLREVGRPVPEERVLCAVSTDFTAEATDPIGWIVAKIR